MQNLITDHLDIWTSAHKTRSTAGRGSNNKLELVGIKKLRELILELAVRGKLVPQDANDEPASELLKKIAAEKAKLIKEGKIKKDRAFSAITDDEYLFDLPIGWEWARLEDVGRDWGQKNPEGTFTYIDVSAIDNTLGKIVEPTVLSAADAPSRARKIVLKGTVIYSTIRPYLQNIAVIENDFIPEAIASTAFAILHPFSEMPAKYFSYYLRSPAFIRYVESVQTGIAYPAINDKQFYSGLVPIPPLPEQHRIVAKVDELMAFCDQLEQTQSDNIAAHAQLVEALLATLTNSSDHNELQNNWQRIAAHFDTLFTTEHSIDQLKQTILQLAVMGKLVPQDSNDEPASELLKKIAAEKAQLIKEGKIKKEKPLPAITDEEKPFELPSGWVWEKLSNITTGMDSGWSPACLANSSPSNEVWGVLKTTAVQIMEYLEFENKELPENLTPRPDAEVKQGDILFTRAGPMNRVGISCLVEKTRPKLMISDKIIRFHPVDSAIYGRFISLCLNAGGTATYLESAKSGMAVSQVNISQEKLRSAPIPVAPFKEQHRIVAKVDEFMSLCDTLKTNLQNAQTTQLALADALVEQAVG